MKSAKILLFYLLSVFKAIYCERLHAQIYSSIEGGASCFRRLNGTHQAGCSSSLNGAVGVVHMVKEFTDAQWLVHNGTAGPYVAVVSTFLFNDIIELLLAEPDNVAGILLYDNVTTRPNDFSHELRCPNEYSSGPGSACSSSQAGGIVWNEKGTGLLRKDIPYPVFYLPASRIEEIEKIEECFNRFNVDLDNQKGRPLCSLQFNSFMFAAVNSVVCLRRSASSTFLTPTKVCDPLGDYNVYSSLFPRSKELEPITKPVILVTARIDTASLFDGVAPGAASSVVGMVTLMVAATTLSQMIPVSDAKNYQKNVLWTLFNGEAFDYIGSQRVAYDIKNSSWPPAAPLSPQDIALHVELGQIGGSFQLFKNSSLPLYAYTSTPLQLTEFLNDLNNHTREIDMNVEPISTTNFPPSSLHSFRNILKNFTESEELLEVLLADFKDTFTNKYYESVLDDYDHINYVYHNISVGSDGKFLSTDELIANGTMNVSEPQVKMARLATAIARTLFKQVTDKYYIGSVAASAHMVDEIMYCFLQSQGCRLLAAADWGWRSDVGPPQPAQLYVGVAGTPSPPAVYAAHLWALLAGTQLPQDRAHCDSLDTPGYSYYWLKGWNNSGVCIQTTMNVSEAVSPAFTIPDYDLRSGVYSSWTESVWQAGVSARVFVGAGGAGARAAALAGAAGTLLAAALTHRLRRHHLLLFPPPPTLTPGIPQTVNC